MYLRDVLHRHARVYSLSDAQDLGRILWRDAMKNPLEVLRTKEQELTKVKKEVEALRITVHLLGENNQTDEAMNLRQVIEMP